LRGDDVFVADFSTIEGYRKGNIIVQPGDIIYIEPVRKSFIEGVREYGPILTLITTLVTLTLVITN
jgi:polysaccharide biosynthesis/export protein